MNIFVRSILLFFFAAVSIAVSARAQSFVTNLHIAKGPVDNSYSPLGMNPITFSGLNSKNHDTLLVKWVVFDSATKLLIPHSETFEMQGIDSIVFRGRPDSVVLLIASKSAPATSIFTVRASDSANATLDSIIFPSIGSGEGGVAMPTELPGDGIVSCYPNPARDNLNFDLTLTHRGLLRLEVYDATGRLVKDFGENEFETGMHQIVWNLHSDEDRAVPNGSYFLMVKSDEGAASINITIAH